jgi:hypothetical protein
MFLPKRFGTYPINLSRYTPDLLQKLIKINDASLEELWANNRDNQLALAYNLAQFVAVEIPISGFSLHHLTARQ